MIIFKSINKLNQNLKITKNLGFVPTMGSLHKGHMKLIKKSNMKCKKTLVSIFVNPNQFNNRNDFKNYPRNLKNDINILKKNKVDYLLIPKIKDVYGVSKKKKFRLYKKDKILCAKFRPGHFEGVLSVIFQFLTKIKIDKLFLGEKDYQQLYLIKSYLNKKFKTKIIGCKTIRYKNTYAYSSRNKLLKDDDYRNLIKVSKILKNYHLSIKKNFKNTIKLKNIKKTIQSLGVKIEYLEVRNKNSLQKNISSKNFKIFIAFYINNVRLIDNF